MTTAAVPAIPSVADLFILAGGFGTRLRSVLPELPKPMAPVAGRPFLEHLMGYWAGQGIARFVISVGYRAEAIRSHFGDSFLSRPVLYVHEKEPLGTGGALALGLREVAWQGTHMLMCNGDTWFEVSLPRLLEDATRRPRPITLSLKSVERNARYGGVAVGPDGLVRSFGAIDGGPGYISAGCYLIDLVEIRTMLAGHQGKFSLEADLLAPLAGTGRIASSIQDAPFIDIGIPEDYARFCALKGGGDRAHMT